MKDPARTVLGYLAAFTLGIVCMGVITLVLLNRSGPEAPSRNPADLPSQDEEQPAPPPPRPQTFQRLRRNPVPELNSITENSDSENSQAQVTHQEPAQNVMPPITTTRIIREAVYQNGPASIPISSDGGRLSGKVKLSGDVPPERPLPLDPDCAARFAKQKIPAQTRFYLRGKDNGLADVIISLVAGVPEARWGAPQRPHLIKEEACLFEPYVSAIQVGQKLSVENRDTILHNLHLLSEANGEFNRAQFRHDSSNFVFTHPEEFVRFKCDVHPWEFAYVSVFDHPFFAVSDKNGSFVIQGVPPGTYTVQARHRKAGVLTKEIKIEANHNADLDFAFTLPAPETASNH